MGLRYSAAESTLNPLDHPFKKKEFYGRLDCISIKLVFIKILKDRNPFCSIFRGWIREKGGEGNPQ